MKIRYDAYSPADNGERIISGGVAEAPPDAGPVALYAILTRAVEIRKLVEPGAQVQVIATRDGDAKPFLTYSWDHA